MANIFTTAFFTVSHTVAIVSVIVSQFLIIAIIAMIAATTPAIGKITPVNTPESEANTADIPPALAIKPPICPTSPIIPFAKFTI